MSIFHKSGHSRDIPLKEEGWLQAVRTRCIHHQNRNNSAKQTTWRPWLGSFLPSVSSHLCHSNNYVGIVYVHFYNITVTFTSVATINLKILKDKQHKVQDTFGQQLCTEDLWQWVTKKRYKQKGKHKLWPKEALDETTLANKYTCTYACTQTPEAQPLEEGVRKTECAVRSCPKQRADSKKV